MKGGETRAAIAAADSVLPKWKEMTSKARSVILRRWYDLIVAHQEDIAVLMTVECGKPLAESRAEVASGVSSVEWFAEECRYPIPSAQAPSHATITLLLYHFTHSLSCLLHSPIAHLSSGGQRGTLSRRWTRVEGCLS